MFGISSNLGRVAEVITPRTHYRGVVRSELFKSGSYEIKITEVIKGRKKVGQYIKARYSDVSFQ
jgi:hypothetical protein